MLMIRVFSICSLSLFLLNAFPAIAQVNWMSWEEAQAKNKSEPKKIIVDVYTQWCGWCKKMDKTTWEEPGISTYVNKNFYAVKFDAETKSDINFNNKDFKYVRSDTSGYHQLASEITFGRLSYPTIVFLDENLNVIQPLPGYQDPNSMNKIMKFFAEDYYKSMPWKKYDEMYQQQHPVTPNSAVPEKKG